MGIDEDKDPQIDEKLLNTMVKAFEVSIQQNFRKTDFRYPPEMHYKHHLMLEKCYSDFENRQEDHAWVRGAKKGENQIKMAATTAFIVSLVGFVFAAVVWYVKTHPSG